MNAVQHAVNNFVPDCRQGWLDFEDLLQEFRTVSPERDNVLFVEGFFTDTPEYALGAKMTEAIRRALFQNMPGVPLYVHPKALTAVLNDPLRQPRKMHGLFDGHQDGKKICMVEISGSDYRARIEATTTSMSLRVKLLSKQP